METVLVKEYRIKTTWGDNELATSNLIDPLLAEMFGENEDEAFQATREYAKEVLTQGEIIMADLEGMITSFHDGYKACLARS